MDNDVVLFLASVALLILYLVFSALTEMGTKQVSLAEVRLPGLTQNS